MIRRSICPASAGRCAGRQRVARLEHGPDQHRQHHGQQPEQGPAGDGPPVARHHGCGRQAGQHNAGTGAGVDQCTQAGVAAQCNLRQAPARRVHKHQRTGHTCQQALRQQQRSVRKKTRQSHEHAGQHRTQHQHLGRAKALQQARRHQRPEKIPQGIDRVHGPCQGVGPAQVRAHRWQQKPIGKARDAQGQCRPGRQSQGQPHDVSRGRQ